MPAPLTRARSAPEFDATAPFRHNRGGGAEEIELGRTSLSPTASRVWPWLRWPVSLLIVLLWIGSTVRLVQANLGDRALALPRIQRELREGRAEFAALYQGRTIGTVRTTITRQDTGWQMINEADLDDLPMTGHLRTRLEISLSAELAPRAFDLTADTRLGEIHATGAATAEGSLAGRIQLGREEVDFRLPPGTYAVLNESLLQNVAVRDLVPGRQYRVPLLDTGSGASLAATIEVENVDLRPAGRLFHLLIRQGDGPPLRAQVTEHGEVQLQDLPFGVTLVRTNTPEAP